MGFIRFLVSLIRGVVISLNMLLIGGFYLIMCILVGYDSVSKWGLTQLWGKIFIWSTTSRLVVKGKENIPKGKGAVYLFSHSSYLDIPALCATKPGQINFAASAFLLSYPILGYIMRVVKAIVVYKDDREKSIEQYKLAEKRLENGENFMISPEGGRSEGEEVLPFKSGPFILAMNAKADLVPVLIYGAHHVWPKPDKISNLRRMFGTIYVEYMPKISIADFTEENRKEKAEEIRQDMIKVLERYQNKN